MMAPITKPIVIMVDSKSCSAGLFIISNKKESNAHTPQIKASLDKNKSQRIGILV